MFSKLGTLWNVVVAAWNGDAFGRLFSAAIKYGPLIAAVIEAIEKNKTAEESQAAATEFERGFRVLTETKDPRLLQDAIMAHCNRDSGCMFP